jgi:hypothetical protein
MAKTKIKVFIATTIDVLVLWLQEAVRPLFSDEPSPVEQLDELSDSKKAFTEFEDSGLPPGFLNDLVQPMLEDGWKKFDFDNEDDDDGEFGSRVIFATMPWGQVVPIPFSSEDWAMVKEISRASGEEIAEVLKGVVNDRFETITNLDPPPQGMFPPGLFEFGQDDEDIDSDE